MDATVQVRQRGTLTLAAELRDRYKIEPGDTYRVLDLDGIFVLAPMSPMVPELARRIEQARRDAGLSIDDLMIALREQRTRYATENVLGGPQDA
jgi:bifunctional DNA-binding transcriptional regulator/antitoxin component of YhaV-PrlF toxin-antitoxin module